jgi:flagellar hook-length control protein FliK
MQINSFGFPLGSGPAATVGAASPLPGFAAAMNLASGAMPTLAPAIQGGTPTLTMPFALSGVSLPAMTDVTTDLVATVPTLPVANGETPLLPGLQPPTTLAQLMATAAPAPAAAARAGEPLAAPIDMAPTIVAAPANVAVTSFSVPSAPVETPPVGAGEETPLVAAEEAPVPGLAPAPAAPANAKPAALNKPGAASAIAPLPAEAAPEAASPTLLDAASTPAKPLVQQAEDKPQTPRKGARMAAEQQPVEKTAAQPQDASAQPTLSAQPMPMPTPVSQQPVAQPATRSGAKGAAAPAAVAGGANPAPADRLAATNGQPTAATGDFARAVIARDGSRDGGASADAEAGREHQVAALGKAEAAPAFTLAATPSTIAPATTAAPAPTEPVIAARAGHVGQALGVEIARKVEAGEDVLRVRLNPDQLGRVEVTLAFDDKGSLQATVRAESAHALELLRQDAPDLARTLDQAGFRTDAQSFRFESRADTGGGNSQTASQQQQGRGNQPQHQNGRDDLEPAPAYRALRADGQVDLLA